MFNPVPKPQKKPRQPLRSKSRIKQTYDPIPDKVKKQVLDRDKYCQGCGGPGVHLHHIIFRSHGGKHEVDNLVYLCNLCHSNAHSYNVWRRHWEQWRDQKYKGEC
jgi:5-methylcytosine-specific restriction endonuclease McrA